MDARTLIHRVLSTLTLAAVAASSLYIYLSHFQTRTALDKVGVTTPVIETTPVCGPAGRTSRGSWASSRGAEARPAAWAGDSGSPRVWEAASA